MPSGGSQRTARRSLFTWIDVARLLSVAFLATILFTDFADPGVTDSSDYVSSLCGRPFGRVRGVRPTVSRA